MNSGIKKEKTPLVSIFCMVYNHGPYIKECLEGFLMQKCNFDYEIVIGEDCSTDNSREIILEYANQYPEKFKLLLHETNIGAAQNQTIVLENCTGKYIAMCEGDDYWTDPLKLQKQVDFLEENNEYSMIGHHTQVFDENTKKNYWLYAPKENEFDLKNGIFGPPVHTSSLVFRKSKINGIKFPNLPSGDEALQLHLLKLGKGYCIPEIMSCYRISQAGTWSMRSQINKNTIHLQIYIWILLNSNFKYLKKQLGRIGKFAYNDIDINLLTRFEFITWRLLYILFKVKRRKWLIK